MKKFFVVLFSLPVLTVSSQNVLINNNPVDLSDQGASVALNVDIRNNPQQQVQYPQQQAIQVNTAVNTGNFFGSNPSVQAVSQQKVGQSIRISGSSGSGYSASQGQLVRHKNKQKSLQLVLQHIFKEKYKKPRHYAKKSRIRKCHRF